MDHGGGSGRRHTDRQDKTLRSSSMSTLPGKLRRRWTRPEVEKCWPWNAATVGQVAYGSFEQGAGGTKLGSANW